MWMICPAKHSMQIVTINLRYRDECSTVLREPQLNKTVS